jgi:hypothetical protein
MSLLDEFDEESSTGTVFRDVIMLALIGFIAMVIMLLPHLHRSKQETREHIAPGNVIIEAHWPSDKPYDVDLWVKGPGSGPVGFWNQGNRLFNLLRDDLGAEGDATNLNYEVSYSRGIPAGEYVANVHMYGPLPPGTIVPVKVVVSVRTEMGDTNQILQTTVLLTHQNQEETAYRFRLTDKGELVAGSVSTLRYSLITGKL